MGGAAPSPSCSEDCLPSPILGPIQGAEASNRDDSQIAPKMAGDLEHLLPPKDSPCQSLGSMGEIALTQLPPKI